LYVATAPDDPASDGQYGLGGDDPNGLLPGSKSFTLQALSKCSENDRNMKKWPEKASKLLIFE
jgi:hypothetical protein